MTPSKEWMALDLDDNAYKAGVQTFVDFAFERLQTRTIRCPCIKCVNVNFKSRDDVQGHLEAYGIIRRYTFWYHHGERFDEFVDVHSDQEQAVNEPVDEMDDIVRDLHPFINEATMRDSHSVIHDADVNCEEEPNDETRRFYKLLHDSQVPLYEGCKASKMSALVKLLHIKTLGRWSNESFTLLLDFLKQELLPTSSNLPDSYYEAKKILKDLGLSYKKIDACVNDCMLFWKEDETLNACKICGASRWKSYKHSGEEKCKSNGKKIPQKTLRYFPLKPRLQRLYMCSKIAPLMTWHHHNKRKEGDDVMTHPSHGTLWESFDKEHADFASEPRNIRLGLSSDGFQPFVNSKKPHTIWPVLLVPYNLPPELCMKQSNLILSMLIPGPQSPGDAIDIYLQPLIEEMNELWADGVTTFDASRRHHFKLRASLFWTINDFPAYGMLSGWSTKGKLACPSCLTHTRSTRLEKSGKECYMGHRRYLNPKHKWRKQAHLFDGTVEKGLPPESTSIDEILQQLESLEDIILSKDPQIKAKVSHKDRSDNWNKKSIFFKLPYWKTLLMHHNLDVMHIEKNICDNILGTILNVKGKTKDTLKAREDLEDMKIRPALHPFKDGDKKKMPDASYVFSLDEKRKFCQFLKDLKVPDGFSSNISYCVNLKEAKISGLKSHDCHVILEHLLPLAIRGLLTPDIREALIELSMFFKILCAKEVSLTNLKQLKTQIPITLCKLEQIFPPSFFVVMMHLPIHLASEAEMGGPVQFRWMFPFEQYMYKLKSYIRNRAHPEASIAEGYLADECMTLCSRYLDSMTTKFNRPDRNYENVNEKGGALEVFCHPGRGLGAQNVREMSKHELDQAHIYILKNCKEVQPYIIKFSEIQASSNVAVSEDQWYKNFKTWFKHEVARLYEHNKSTEMEDLLSLSRGPTQYVTSFSGYITNGYRFHIEDREKTLKTQNSGVVVFGNTGDEVDNIDYFGTLTDIIELQYLGGNRVVLFRCKWWDVYDKLRGIKIDEYGFVSVNCKRQLKSDEPFALGSQASQVFYATDVINKGWHVVLNNPAHSSHQFSSDNDSMCDNPEGSACQQGQRKRRRVE